MNHDSPYALVTLRLASGELVGPLNMQGAGGAIARHSDPARTRAHFELLISRATEGLPLSCFEPEPGHCWMMRRRWHGDEDGRRVDLRGAVVIDVS